MNVPLKAEIRILSPQARYCPRAGHDLHSPRLCHKEERIEKGLIVQDQWIQPENAQISRVFRLPKTHAIEHFSSNDSEHLKFHIWALSFFTGMRLTTEEAGFLDATPIEPGILVNFVIHHEEIGSAVEYAEKFWLCNRTQDRQRDRFCAAVHALFLSQNPQYLQFERFFYLYVTLDACFSMLWGTKSAKKKPSHAERTRWMCERLEIPVPAGATPEPTNPRS